MRSGAVSLPSRRLSETAGPSPSLPPSLPPSPPPSLPSLPPSLPPSPPLCPCLASLSVPDCRPNAGPSYPRRGLPEFGKSARCRWPGLTLIPTLRQRNNNDARGSSSPKHFQLVAFQTSNRVLLRFVLAACSQAYSRRQCTPQFSPQGHACQTRKLNENLHLTTRRLESR